jgi:hypothetical protein
MKTSSVNFIHLLDLTRSSFEICNYRPSAEIEHVTLRFRCSVLTNWATEISYRTLTASSCIYGIWKVKCMSKYHDFGAVKQYFSVSVPQDLQRKPWNRRFSLGWLISKLVKTQTRTQALSTKEPGYEVGQGQNTFRSKQSGQRGRKCILKDCWSLFSSVIMDMIRNRSRRTFTKYVSQYNRRNLRQFCYLNHVLII